MSDDTAPSTPKVGGGMASLTPREGDMLAKAWSCLKTGPPEVSFSMMLFTFS